MKKSHTAISLSLLSLLVACSATANEVKDPEGYKTLVNQREASNDRIKRDSRSVPKIMQDFDKAIDKYFTARTKKEHDRARTLEKSLDQILRQEVRRNFYLLLSKADNPKQQADRGIALVALGFADATEEVFDETKDDKFLVTKRQKLVKSEANRKYARMALNSMVTALNDDDEGIVERALLGIGVLGHEETPIQEIGMILESDKNTLALRRNAASTLAVIEGKLTPKSRSTIRPILQRVLLEPLGAVHPTIVVPCLRTLGRFRDKSDSKIVEPYCGHPDALVRIRSAIALGMIMNQESFPTLLELIKDKETNLNVRLAARKSLKALAGGKDRGYDVKEWQRLFQRK